MKSTRTYLTVLLFLTTVAGFALAYREYLEITSLRDRIEDPNTGLQKKYDDALALIKNLRAELDAAKGKLVAAATRARSGNEEAGGRLDGRPRDFRRAGEAMRALFESPQFQALRGLQEKGRLDQRYALLFRLLSENGVSTQQIDQLKNLLVQRQQAAMDAVQAARQNGINPRTDPSEFQQAIADATSEMDTQIKAALGDSAYAQYQQYQQTLPEQTVVNRLQQTLSYTSTPLTDAEAQQLVQVLQQNAPAASNGSGGGPNVFVGGGGMAVVTGGGPVAITPQAIAQAASMLSPAQVQALQQIQQQQQAQQQMRALMRSTFQSQRQSGGAAAAPGG
ncbi:MAG: hypothetical protein ACREFX_07920 [Opitutaceae bacterium]